MGSFSTCRALVHWQGLLLAVSLLYLWSLPTTAQLTIVSTTVAYGEDVVLHIRNKPHTAVSVFWYKGDSPNRNHLILLLTLRSRKLRIGPLFSGREILNYDGTLLIRNVAMEDAGMYTVVFHLEGSLKEIGFGRLKVYDPVMFANLLASNETVTENKDAVVLTCYTNAVSIQWFFNGWYLPFTERMKLSEDGRSLTIDPVKKEDAGFYQCEASNPIKTIYTWPVELHVKFD